MFLSFPLLWHHTHFSHVLVFSLALTPCTFQSCSCLFPCSVTPCTFQSCSCLFPCSDTMRISFMFLSFPLLWHHAHFSHVLVFSIALTPCAFQSYSCLFPCSDTMRISVMFLSFPLLWHHAHFSHVFVFSIALTPCAFQSCSCLFPWSDTMRISVMFLSFPLLWHHAHFSHVLVFSLALTPCAFQSCSCLCAFQSSPVSLLLLSNSPAFCSVRHGWFYSILVHFIFQLCWYDTMFLSHATPAVSLHFEGNFHSGVRKEKQCSNLEKVLLDPIFMIWKCELFTHWIVFLETSRRFDLSTRILGHAKENTTWPRLLVESSWEVETSWSFKKHDPVSEQFTCQCSNYLHLTCPNHLNHLSIASLDTFTTPTALHVRCTCTLFVLEFLYIHTQFTYLYYSRSRFFCSPCNNNYIAQLWPFIGRALRLCWQENATTVLAD